jgi:4,5-DOPA dioxygenase extradiol
MSAHEPRIPRRAVLGAGVGLALGAAGRAANADALVPRPKKVPQLVISHGSPRLAFDPARYTPFRAWGAQLPQPRGIVVMTPHFAARRVLLGSTKQGFAMYNLPPALKRQLPQDLEYATPPSDALADAVEACLHGAHEVTRLPDRRGFDHTTWIPLLHLFPRAEVPVLEIGYPYLRDAELFELGRRLAPLREQRIMFVASGGITHNLAAVDFRFTPGAEVPAWSKEFDAWVTESLDAHAVDALVDWRHKAPGAEISHPDDGAHFRVLLVALGLASAGGTQPAASYPVTGYESAMSIRCVELG